MIIIVSSCCCSSLAMSCYLLTVHSHIEERYEPGGAEADTNQRDTQGIALENFDALCQIETSGCESAPPFGSTGRRLASLRSSTTGFSKGARRAITNSLTLLPKFSSR
ncbi:hypothetical protein BKA67DRAFT_311383 [Truncatella angustata]|uniref:Secreted protein n=1 Tax=Truncatella angustata TaxID=152316 RepID=A0A9P8UJE7_9PEZI|nr:uncharacterized protein BKA67DRAFT_311383 [Truncatella angustata]KAH6653196.1 hypothetical protein BKA67DRAFT_311383 [Truncatella angustata]